jgi:6-phosphofructokinase 1
MKKLMETHWKETKSEGKVFLIDPSYMIRSVPANSGDNMLCIQLAQAAVHTAFSGYSGVTVGRFHDMFGVMPIDLVVDGHRRVNPKGSIWQTVKARLSFYPGDTIPAHDRPVIDHHHAI